MTDRAICMPYAKPQVLRSGHRRQIGTNGRWQTQASILEDTAAAAAFIVGSLESPHAHKDWSKAELALDPAGPWWSKPRDDFLGLSSDERDWVLDRLEDTVATAASHLQDRATKRRWTWLWSQPSFATPGKLRPSITRPDLVGGLDWTRCEIIDLKTTSRPELSAVMTTQLRRALASWAGSLRALGFDPVSCHALAVSATTGKAAWIEAPVDSTDDVGESDA